MAKKRRCPFPAKHYLDVEAARLSAVNASLGRHSISPRAVEPVRCHRCGGWILRGKKDA